MGWMKLSKTFIPPSHPNTKVSVIVACRNEEDHIEDCIQSLMNQSYPKDLYELIIVNDHSDDKTVEVIESIISSESNIHLHHASQGEGKRNALTEGIALAKGDFIMTTDADCWVSLEWIETIIENYQHTRAKMILGPVEFKQGNSLLTKFQDLDFMGMIGIAGGSTANQYPHVCNGANLSYEKEAFYQINGFEGEEKNPSGDDMILLQKMNLKYKGQIEFVKSQKAMTYTHPMYNWKDFFNQRIRWASKSGELLDKKISVILGLVLLYNLLSFVFIVLSFFKPIVIWLLLFHVVIKLLIDFLFLKEVLGFFNRRSLLFFYPIAQIMHLFYIIIVGIMSQISSFEWKGRKIQA